MRNTSRLSNGEERAAAGVDVVVVVGCVPLYSRDARGRGGGGGGGGGDRQGGIDRRCGLVLECGLAWTLDAAATISRARDSQLPQTSTSILQSKQIRVRVISQWAEPYTLTRAAAAGAAAAAPPPPPSPPALAAIQPVMTNRRPARAIQIVTHTPESFNSLQ